MYGTDEKFVPIKLKEDYCWWKVVLLNILTIGLYGFAVFLQIPDDLERVSINKTRSKLLNYFYVWLASGITGGIIGLYWGHSLATRIEELLDERKMDSICTPGDFWKWYFFGQLILIGPWVFWHKFFKALNLLNHTYNLEQEALAKEVNKGKRFY